MCITNIFKCYGPCHSEKNNNASTNYKYTRVTTIVITKVRTHYE